MSKSILPARVSGLALMLCSVLTGALLGLPALAQGAVCPNAATRGGLSGALPECRAYELVTPPYKGGFPLAAQYISSNGEHVILETLGDFGEAENSAGLNGTTYELTRTSQGWTHTPFNLPVSQSTLMELKAVSSDFSHTLWNIYPGLEGHGFRAGLYMRDSAGSFARVSSEAGLVPIAASRDLSHIVFAPEQEGVQVVKGQLYEDVDFGEMGPAAVSVSGGPGSTTPISTCGASLGGPGETRGHSVYNAVSGEGGVVFFTATACQGGPPVDALYARVDGSETVAISEPSPSECGSSEPCLEASGKPADANFEGASESGSRVFFTSTQALVAGASEDSTPADDAVAKAGTSGGCAVTTGSGGCNLYEYEGVGTPAGHLVLVSGGSSEAQGARVQGVARISEDGSRVYFVAKGVLTSRPSLDAQGLGAHGEPVGVGAVAQPGAENLYVFDTETGQTAFIGDLAPGDSQDWQAEDLRPVEATPDGRFMVFTSEARLTLDDTSSVQQIFEYDAQSESLVRVSIGQEGYNNNGNTSQFSPEAGSPNYGGTSFFPSKERFRLADDGAVFFLSEDGLTPQALNGVVIGEAALHPLYAENVYEYREGSVWLISDGKDVAVLNGQVAVSLVGVDRSGEDVFFNTGDQLVGQDTDTEIDIYDARVDGGFPAPVTPVSCSQDACQGPLAGTPVLLSPGSEFQAGGGNLQQAASSSGVKIKAKLNKKANAKKKKKRIKAKSKGKVKTRQAKRVGNRQRGR